MPILSVENKEEFENYLSTAGESLIIADFTATWCGACRIIEPRLENLSNAYSKVIFLKLDVEKCPDVATTEEIFVLPTFVLYRKSAEVSRVEGTDLAMLEVKIKEICPECDDNDDSAKGMTELNKFISKEQSECLNESNVHTMVNALEVGADKFLQSDTDGQLLLSLTFNQPVKIHSFIIQGPRESGPKDIRLFKNLPKTLSFSELDNILSTQDFEMSGNDLEHGNPVRLRYVRFQNVQNLQIFVENNQSQTNKTQINYIGFVGRPVAITHLKDIVPIVTPVDMPSTSKDISDISDFDFDAFEDSHNTDTEEKPDDSKDHPKSDTHHNEKPT